ncbi:MAG: hypothetical protein LBM99_01525, partial [Bacillales bacterium]|nr:hypothetical protein [Bacillales bacterium]
MKKLLLPLFVLGLSACVVTPSNSSLSSIPSSNSLSDSSISSSDVVSVIIEAEEALEVYERLYNEFVGSFDNIDGYTLTNAMHSEGVGSPEIFELEYDILGFLTTTATLNVNYETVAMYEELSTEIIYTNLDGSPLDIEMPIEIPIELLNNSEKNLAFYD